MDDSKNSTAIDAIARNCSAVRLRRLNRVITNLYDHALRPLGMNVSQLNILVVAAKLGLALPTEVCKILQMDASTLRALAEISWANMKKLRTRSSPWFFIPPTTEGRFRPCFSWKQRRPCSASVGVQSHLIAAFASMKLPNLFLRGP